MYRATHIGAIDGFQGYKLEWDERWCTVRLVFPSGDVGEWFRGYTKDELERTKWVMKSVKPKYMENK